MMLSLLSEGWGGVAEGAGSWLGEGGWVLFSWMGARGGVCCYHMVSWNSFVQWRYCNATCFAASCV